MMLEELLNRLNNWFVDVQLRGRFTVEGGHLDVTYIPDGQYFRIIGSLFNDGLHQAPADDLKDETFSGTLQTLKIPPAVVKLADDIVEWCEANSDALNSPYTSESFGGYSYSKAADDNSPMGWEYHFRNRINQWKKL